MTFYGTIVTSNKIEDENRGGYRQVKIKIAL